MLLIFTYSLAIGDWPFTLSNALRVPYTNPIKSHYSIWHDQTNQNCFLRLEWCHCHHLFFFIIAAGVAFASFMAKSGISDSSFLFVFALPAVAIISSWKINQSWLAFLSTIWLNSHKHEGKVDALCNEKGGMMCF